MLKHLRNSAGPSGLNWLEAVNNAVLPIPVLGPRAIKLVVGAPTPSYTPAIWKRLAEEPEDVTSRWVRVAGDREAGLWTKDRGTAVILAAGKTGLRNLQLELIEKGVEPRPAVAYVVNNVVHVGLLPGGRTFGRVISVPHTEGVALRRGPDELQATLGWYGETEKGGHLVVPDDVHKALDITDVRNIHRVEPHVWLA